jgi:hypothetical protein
VVLARVVESLSRMWVPFVATLFVVNGVLQLVWFCLTCLVMFIVNKLELGVRVG